MGVLTAGLLGKSPLFLMSSHGALSFLRSTVASPKSKKKGLPGPEDLCGLVIALCLGWTSAVPQHLPGQACHSRRPEGLLVLRGWAGVSGMQGWPWEPPWGWNVVPVVLGGNAVGVGVQGWTRVGRGPTVGRGHSDVSAAPVRGAEAPLDWKWLVGWC